MAIRQRKSSARVTLVLLGAAALAACGQEDESLRRDLYASKDDCVQDWGDELKCEPQTSTENSFGFRSAYWYGPIYRSGQYGSDPQIQPAGTVSRARPGSHSIGTSHVSRGGFGASGAAHGHGGS